MDILCILLPVLSPQCSKGPHTVSRTRYGVDIGGDGTLFFHIW